MIPAIDILGCTFGKLSVVERAPAIPPATSAHWRCLCSCGRSVVLPSIRLRSGSAKSCGCSRHIRNMEDRYADDIGKTFGRLTFQAVADQRGDNNRAIGVFICECGTSISFAIGRILSGKKTHCGCLTDRGAHRTHGMRGSPEYTSWQAMKARCLDINNKDYPRWGGKGISVCREWIDSFESFYAYVGPRPKATSLDRIDGRRGYEPGNVRWATSVEQARNRAASYRWHIRGILFESHGEAAAHFGVSDHTIWRWVNGQHDKRRNKFTPAREDCYVIPRY